jgi:hypothetical protein
MDDPGQGVRTYLDEITPEKLRGDAERLLELMARVTGEAPHMWGKIIGFGQYHYKYESGREGDAPAAAFAPRRAATVIYLADGIGRYAEPTRAVGAAHHRCRMPIHQRSRQDRLIGSRKDHRRVASDLDGGHVQQSGS